jgi:hypothetical protein
LRSVLIRRFSGTFWELLRNGLTLTRELSGAGSSER